ncbi:hypothetical protein CLV84_0839 [Neolewinella xylanilytica]|uniref:Uncharacterized protein n=1 Tax=Neolewinella xylanilytica TaxID=1514080 RepID=A0A2S6I8Q9_9BACT|nr:hypothetical protein CLV84_0839 [Neolewinella xylanilytica]
MVSLGGRIQDLDDTPFCGKTLFVRVKLVSCSAQIDFNLRQLTLS